MADEQAALLAQIKALSGAIDQRKSSIPYSRGGSYASRGRGRGRGGQPIAGPSNPSRHRSLILSGSAVNKDNGKVEGEYEQSELPNGATPIQANDPNGKQDAWIKRKSTHNMSLVSKSAFDKTEPARLAALAASQSARLSSKQQAKSSKTKSKGNNSIRRGDNMGEVVIDGVVFQFDESGTKLIKKDPQPSSNDIPDSPISNATPLQTSVDGQKYVRTKTGNLISKELLEKREAKKRLNRLGEIGKDIGMRQRGSGRKGGMTRVVRKRGLCSFYNKTGQCKRGLSCPYTHNPDKVAICPGILRPTGCILPAGSCPLSHDKRAERVPHCVHYLRLGSCRNGDDCDYTHPSAGVHLTNESPICMDFSDLGWCQRGAACPERHTWDCPDFLRSGECSRKGCKLMHVIRGENLKPREEEMHIADDDLFVRDDGGADGSDEDSTGQKRKRGDEEELSEEEVNPTWKTKRTKDFTRQEDFISLGGGDEEEEDMEDEDSEEDIGDEEEQSSVHSDSSVE